MLHGGTRVPGPGSPGFSASHIALVTMAAASESVTRGGGGAPPPPQRARGSIPPSQRPEVTEAAAAVAPAEPFTVRDPVTGYPSAINPQYSDPRRANDASAEVDAFARGGIHCHMVAQIAAASVAASEVTHAWAAAHPDVVYLDPRGVNPAHLSAFILARLDFLTAEEAHAKRNGPTAKSQMPPPVSAATGGQRGLRRTHSQAEPAPDRDSPDPYPEYVP